jgi:histidinol-phosphate aminotransferase
LKQKIMTKPCCHPWLSALSPYVGGEVFSPHRKTVRLSYNEGAFGPSPVAIDAYRAALPHLDRYPDIQSSSLRDALASQYDLDAENIVCGAGSDELLTILARTYAGPGDEVLYSSYGFMMYPVIAKAAGATPIAVPEHDFKADIDSILAHVTDRTKVVFLANPNNPTGSYIPAPELRRLQANLPSRVLLVLDEAYAEYMDAPDYESGLTLAKTAPNIVVTRTFSKIYGLAGLRVGWAYGPKDVICMLDRLRLPFNINAPAQAAAEAALGDQAFVQKVRLHTKTWRIWTQDALAELGIPTLPATANYLLAHFGTAERAAAALKFLGDRDIHVRGMRSYALPERLRISIGLEDDMKILISGLKDFIKTHD